MKEIELEVLNHQLQGIMDCTDMSNLFGLLKMRELCKYQNRRMIALMNIFQQTSQLFISHYQEIPVVATNFQRLFNSTEVTPESTALLPKVFQNWIDWETQSIDLYTQMSEDYPKIQFWKRLLTSSKLYLKNAQYCKSKYIPPGDTKAVVNNLNSSDIRQRMQERLAATQK